MCNFRFSIVFSVIMICASSLSADEFLSREDSDISRETCKISLHYLSVYCDSSGLIGEENRVLAGKGAFLPTDKWDYRLIRRGVSFDYSPEILHLYSAPSTGHGREFCGCGSFMGSTQPWYKDES